MASELMSPAAKIEIHPSCPTSRAKAAGKVRKPKPICAVKIKIPSCLLVILFRSVNYPSPFLFRLSPGIIFRKWLQGVLMNISLNPDG